MATATTENNLAVYAAHNEQIRALEAKLSEEKFKRIEDAAILNDRRYGEVNVEKEKALKIKETADLTALELARESQVYKDERNDAMREQSLKDNGIYATRDDLAEVVRGMEKALKPLVDYVSGQQGAVQGSKFTAGKIIAGITLGATIIGVFVVLANMLVK